MKLFQLFSFSFVLQFIIAITMFFLCTELVYSQISQPNAIRAAKASSEIKLDGVLDEAVWSNTGQISNFTQREPNFGLPATERTEVSVVYTSDALYIGAKMYVDSANEIIAKEMIRDFDNSCDDGFIILIDSYLDKTNGYAFIVNPNGAVRDIQIVENGNRTNGNWNGVWDAKIKRDSLSWTAEIYIPFSTLKFAHKEAQNWGINFERDIRSKREIDLWQGFSRNYSIVTVSQAGTLLGLNDIENKQNIEFKPYVVGGFESSKSFSTTDNKTVYSNTTKKDFGFDVNYLPTPSIKINLTYNTDFAQVESDNMQVNLTRFPLYYAEKREFFLEGSDYFTIGMGNRIYPFYSRKIGITSSGSIAPILFGARALGKEGGTTFGLMSIETEANSGDPAANYTIFNVRQSLFGQSYVGILSANKIDKDNAHSTTGFYSKYSNDDFLGTGRNFVWDVAYLHNFNSDTTFLSDAHAYRTFLSYSGDAISVATSWQRCPKEFSPQAGFLARHNFQETFFSVTYKYRFSDDNPLFTSITCTPGDITYDRYDDTKQMQSFDYGMTLASIEFKSGDVIDFGCDRIGEGVREPFTITAEHGDTLLIDAREYWYNDYWTSFSTYSSRDLSFGASMVYSGMYSGDGLSYSLNTGYRINKYVKVSFAYSGDNYLIDGSRVKSDIISGRFNLSLNPKLFGSIFAQWNNSADQLIINYRVNFIPILGGDFFFVLNQTFNTKGGLAVQNTTALAKLVWRFS